MSRIVLAHANGYLLGDKVLLSAIRRGLADESPSSDIWGVEGPEPMRMAYFDPPPDRVLRGDLTAITRRLVDQALGGSPLRVLVHRDHNSRFDWELLWREEVVEVRDLWTELARLAERRVYPRVRVRASWQAEARRILRERFGGSSEPATPLVVISNRVMGYESWKNSDPEIVSRTAQLLCEEVGARVVIVGAGLPARLRVRSEGVIELTPRELPLEPCIGMLSLASLYIGGDTGPTHLAGAVGTKVCGVGYTTRRFGPFLPKPQLLGVYGPSHSGGIERLEDVCSLVAHLCAALPRGS